MAFLPVILWSDVLIWLLFVAAAIFGWLSLRNPLWRTAWQRVGHSRAGMASATVLLVFVVVGLLDSLHYRPRLENPAGQGQRQGSSAARRPAKAAGQRRPANSRQPTPSRCCRCSTRS
jgi:peptide/nickel transport system permease protein